MIIIILKSEFRKLKLKIKNVHFDDVFAHADRLFQLVFP